MTLTRAITLPPPSAQGGGGILNNADPLDDGWTRGVEFATEACLAAGEHVFCPDSPSEKTFQGTSLAAFAPVLIEVGVECTTLSGAQNIAEREARAFQALTAKAEKSVGYVLATGETQAGVVVETPQGPNPNLGQATDVGTAADAASALALIEDEIGDVLGGYQAWVHVTPRTLTELVAGFAVYRDAGDWLTPNGNVVVASPGYVGNLDGMIVATTEVFANVGTIERIRTVNRENNTYMVLHEAPALAVFDPCFNVSVDFETSP